MCENGNLQLLEAGSVDAATEKHVPVVERNGSQIRVSVGSVEHPMTEEHWIEWIALATEKSITVHYLTPEDKPETVFELAEGEKASVYEYCNLHGLWKTEL